MQRPYHCKTYSMSMLLHEGKWLSHHTCMNPLGFSKTEKQIWPVKKISWADYFLYCTRFKAEVNYFTSNVLYAFRIPAYRWKCIWRKTVLTLIDSFIFFFYITVWFIYPSNKRKINIFGKIFQAFTPTMFECMYYIYHFLFHICRKELNTILRIFFFFIL